MYLIPSRLCTFIFAERPKMWFVILYNISAGFLPPTKRPIPTIQGIVGCTPTNVPLWEIPIYPYIVSVYGSLSPRIPTFSPYKYHGAPRTWTGYTRPCPLNPPRMGQIQGASCDFSEASMNGTSLPQKKWPAGSTEPWNLRWYENRSSSGWWFQIFVIFTPKLGEDEPILTSIFFKGVETTNWSWMVDFEKRDPWWWVWPFGKSPQKTPKNKNWSGLEIHWLSSSRAITWQKTFGDLHILPSLKLTFCPWKWMVGRWIFFWDGLFWGANC